MHVEMLAQVVLKRGKIASDCYKLQKATSGEQWQQNFKQKQGNLHETQAEAKVKETAAQSHFSSDSFPTITTTWEWRFYMGKCLLSINFDTLHLYILVFYLYSTTV